MHKDEWIYCKISEYRKSERRDADDKSEHRALKYKKPKSWIIIQCRRWKKERRFLGSTAEKAKLLARRKKERKKALKNQKKSIAGRELQKKTKDDVAIFPSVIFSLNKREAYSA